ncbi:cbb3-type cytochrome c oxidase subunit I, partial [Leclercia adecarboxylata]|uniref:cbb3-type cytochrome c oxidase subunit I n=1 Tax=Leclercia adecarboxylata TaxID=83655 RepID=UPI00234C40E0
MNPTQKSGAPAANLEQMQDEFDKVWGNPRGWRALTIVNHTSIGLRFLVTGAFFFLVGGLLAMLIRTQLALPGYELMEPDVYNQVFTMHGTVVLLYYETPIVFGFANLAVPLQIGPADVAFPRLNAFSFWLFLFGAMIAIAG